MDAHLDDDGDVDESLLLRQYVQGSSDAARQLADRFLPLVLGHAHRMLGDEADAEDVAQEAMMRLWRIAPDWKSGEAQVSTWLYRVTANLCIDRLRAKKTSPLDDADEPVDHAMPVAEVIQQKTRFDALQEALLTLPERQRQAVVLRHIDGLSNREIGEIMDISARAVESLTARGKSALSTVLSRRKSELGYENG